MQKQGRDCSSYLKQSTGLLQRAQGFLLNWDRGVLPAPVAAVHLYAARESLSDLIGTVDTEEVLDRVFREFCIGK